MTEQTTL